MVWKVRADCTYTSTTNKTTRQSAAQTLIDSYPAAELPSTTGRFGPGLTSQSTTRFTVAFDFDDGPTAVQFANDLTTSVATSARSATLVSVHNAGT